MRRYSEYAGFVSGDVRLTMIIHLRSDMSARLEDLFLIFMNRNRSYPIFKGVYCCTQPRGWMGSLNFHQWLQQCRAIINDSDGRLRVLFSENCSGHK